jgi:hypothetical protein
MVSTDPRGQTPEVHGHARGRDRRGAARVDRDRLHPGTRAGDRPATRVRDAGLQMSCPGLFRPSSRCGTWSTQGGRSEGSLAHCGRDGPRPANHQLGRREAAVPTGVYDNWGFSGRSNDLEAVGRVGRCARLDRVLGGDRQSPLRAGQPIPPAPAPRRSGSSRCPTLQKSREVLVMVYLFQGRQRVLGGLRDRRLFRPPRRKRPAGREFHWAETGGVKSRVSGPSRPPYQGVSDV